MSELKGTNWEVIPNLIGRQQAAAAYSSFLVLKPESLQPPYISREFGRGRRLRVGERSPVTILEIILNKIPEQERTSLAPLLSIFDEIRARFGDPRRNPDRDRLFLNSFPPGSSTGEHKDDLLSQTIAVGLVGSAELHIRDPGTQQKQPVINMSPASALHLFNVRDNPALNPTHEVINIGNIPRVSLVVQV